MALIPFTELVTRWQEFGAAALARIEADATEKAALREAVTAAGLPDDQVPPPAQDDTALTEALGRMAALTPVEPAEPGGDVLPDTDELPEVPVTP